MTDGSIGKADFRRIWGCGDDPFATGGLNGLPCETRCIGDTGCSFCKHTWVSGRRYGLTLAGGLSIPGSASGTESSARLLSKLKLSLPSNPLAVISTDTSVISSSSNGSGGAGGESVNHLGRSSLP